MYFTKLSCTPLGIGKGGTFDYRNCKDVSKSFHDYAYQTYTYHGLNNPILSLPIFIANNNQR